MRRIILLIAAIILAVAAGPSQQPAPGGREARQPPQQISDEHAAQPNPDQRGTEDRPLFIKPILPPKSEKEAAQDANDRAEKAAADWWMVRLTGLIALIGFGQGIVFAVQADQLRKTIRKMDEIATIQTKDMADSIAQAAKAATAMETAAIHMGDSAASTKRSVELLVRFERAYISFGATFQQIGDKTLFVMAFENAGKTSAILVDIHICMRTIAGLPAVPDYSGSTTREKNLVVPAMPVPRVIENVEFEIGTVCVYGYFRYRDILQELHTTWFAQGYNGQAWAVIGGDAYNHYD